MSPRQPVPIEIFCSYAHADERLRRELEKHLSSLHRQGLFTIWHDRQIIPGTDWAHTIDTHLNTARIILLLISADFFVSDYCYGIEMQRAMERHKANEALVIPILLRPVDWKGAPFEGLQMLPTGAKPVLSWRKRDEAFADVAAGIRRAIEDLNLLPISAPSSSLPPVWNIPYPRNPFFTGREDILLRLISELQTRQATALTQPLAISGLGGIGKTQIAVEYAYRTRSQYKAVLWGRADTREALIASFATFARLLNLPEQNAQDQFITVQAVKVWLQEHRDWLLILDNADNLSVVYDFLPPSFGGHLLLTTRTQAMGRLAQRIDINTLTPEEGALFLLRRANIIATDVALDQVDAHDRASALEINRALGGLPLALDQAGAYLEETGCSLTDYQQIYQQRRAELLKERGGYVADHPDSVATTWLLSFEQLKQISPAAIELLWLCAYLDADNIAEEIITRGAPHLGPHLEPVAIDTYLLNQTLEALRAYSLIRRDSKNKTLTIHRLMQAVIQDAMSPEVSNSWVERAVLAVGAAFPTPEEYTEWFVAWPACERCLPHALVCANWIEQWHMTFLEAALLLNQTGLYLFERARYAEAEALLQRALAIREQRLGPQHPFTAICLNNLGTNYMAQGKDAEAEPLLQRALAIREQCLGPQHPMTAQSLSRLATLYIKQGKDAEAEPLFQRALEISERYLGRQHPDTAGCLNDMAMFYVKQGKDAEAESLAQRALEIYELHLGESHPHTAVGSANLGIIYMNQGRYAEAESLLQRAINIQEKQLGELHPTTAKSLGNLGALYVSQEKYVEAEPLLQRALTINEQLLGMHHPDTAGNLIGLAELYLVQGKYEEVKQLLQGRYVEAEPLLVHMLDTYNIQPGDQLPDKDQNLDNLLALYANQGEFDQAELLLQRTLTIREQLIGMHHPDTARILNKLATLYINQSKYIEAEPLFLRALEINEQQLGVQHLDTAKVLGNLSHLYRCQSKFTEAEQLADRALEIYEQQLGMQHLDTAKALSNLATIYADQGKLIEAEPLFLRALEINEQQLGMQHPEVAQSLRNLAILRAMQGKLEEVEPLLRRSLGIYKEKLGVQHPATQECLKMYVLLLRALGQEAEAAQFEALILT